MQQVSFRFSQLDSWFFREARPMESIGGSELSSVFPPPVSTLAGSIRTLIGDIMNIDWAAYNKGLSQELLLPDVDPKKMIGAGENCGDLMFSYPEVEVRKTRGKGKWLALKPLPLDLLVIKEEGKITKVVYLTIGETPIRCDLGNVLLPLMDIEDGEERPQTIENAWLTPDGWKQYLEGKPPEPDCIVELNELIIKESRKGIGRDNEKAVVNSGLLYQTEHIRLKQERFEEVAIKVNVSGIVPALATLLTQQNQAVRLGGEGRLAFVEVEKIEQAKNIAVKSSNNKYKIVFNSPASFSYETNLMTKGHWLPSDFIQESQDETDVFVGLINQKKVTLFSQISGKPQRVGGWDSAKNAPKPLRSFVPAGTCWYIETDEPEGLYEQYIGELVSFGYGKISLLSWNSKK
jgi:CRISPR-associated protein Cmr3